MIQKELKWSSLQKDNVLENYDKTPIISVLEQNVTKVNQITFQIGDSNKEIQRFEIMIGICDLKIRNERGMLFQDKSFVGHGTYLLYSIGTNSFAFSHWDLDTNYNEAGFSFKNGDTIQVIFDQEKSLVIIKDVKNKANQFQMKIEHHNIEDIHLCVVISEGRLTYI